MSSIRYILLLALLAIALAVAFLPLTVANLESPGTVVNLESPGIETPNLIITDNVIEDNGFGIYVGWHGEWVSEISGNLIVNNGEGIRIVNKVATIFDNVIRDNITGVRVTATHQGEVVTEVIAVSLFRNVIVGNFFYGLQNLTDLTIDARDNWWGSPAGPRLVGAPPPEVVAEETVYEDVEAPFERIFGPVQYTGWRTEAFSPFPHPEDRTQSEDTEKPENDGAAGEEG